MTHNKEVKKLFGQVKNKILNYYLLLNLQDSAYAITKEYYALYVRYLPVN